MPRLEVKRRLEQPDFGAVSDLLAVAREADGQRLLREGATEPPCGPLARLVAWEPGKARPVGYAQLTREGTSWDLELVLDPDYEGSAVALGEEVTDTALDVVRQEGGGRVHLWVPSPHNGGGVHEQVARNAGMEGERHLHQMRRPLPVEDQATIATRAFHVGVDEDGWLQVNRRAFAGQPDQSGWDWQDLGCREAEPWFDPAGFILHERDGRLAGFCWTKVHGDTDPAFGELYVLGVDPDFQGLGLGRELALAGLAHLWRRGLGTAMLYVDGSNHRALRLYRALAFEDHHVELAYVTDVPPTKDPST